MASEDSAIPAVREALLGLGREILQKQKMLSWTGT